ncbi:MAG: hypothetical protein ACRCXT_00760 [Paraclostridium sp.]
MNNDVKKFLELVYKFEHISIVGVHRQIMSCDIYKVIDVIPTYMSKKEYTINDSNYIVNDDTIIRGLHILYRFMNDNNIKTMEVLFKLYSMCELIKNITDFDYMCALEIYKFLENIEYYKIHINKCSTLIEYESYIKSKDSRILYVMVEPDCLRKYNLKVEIILKDGYVFKSGDSQYINNIKLKNINNLDVIHIPDIYELYDNIVYEHDEVRKLVKIDRVNGMYKIYKVVYNQSIYRMNRAINSVINGINDNSNIVENIDISMIMSELSDRINEINSSSSDVKTKKIIDFTSQFIYSILPILKNDTLKLASDIITKCNGGIK